LKKIYTEGMTEKVENELILASFGIAGSNMPLFDFLHIMSGVE